MNYSPDNVKKTYVLVIILNIIGEKSSSNNESVMVWENDEFTDNIGHSIM